MKKTLAAALLVTTCALCWASSAVAGPLHGITITKTHGGYTWADGTGTTWQTSPPTTVPVTTTTVPPTTTTTPARCPSITWSWTSPTGAIASGNSGISPDFTMPCGSVTLSFVATSPPVNRLAVSLYWSTSTGNKSEVVWSQNYPPYVVQSSVTITAPDGDGMSYWLVVDPPLDWSSTIG